MQPGTAGVDSLNASEDDQRSPFDSTFIDHKNRFTGAQATQSPGQVCLRDATPRRARDGPDGRGSLFLRQFEVGHPFLWPLVPCGLRKRAGPHAEAVAAAGLDLQLGRNARPANPGESWASRVFATLSSKAQIRNAGDAFRRASVRDRGGRESGNPAARSCDPPHPRPPGRRAKIRQGKSMASGDAIP